MAVVKGKIKPPVYVEGVATYPDEFYPKTSSDIVVDPDTQETVKSQIDALSSEKADNSRVDAIITTPVEGVSAQEVIDARQGKASLGANLTEVRAQITALDADVKTQLADIAEEKIDEVVFDVLTFSMKFYANGILLKTIDISEAGNASAVQAYIDSLVSDGLIEGVTLADGTVTIEKLAPELQSIFIEEGQTWEV